MVNNIWSTTNSCGVEAQFYYFTYAIKCCENGRDVKFHHLHGKKSEIHGIPIADSCEGAVMQKPLTVQQCFRLDISQNALDFFNLFGQP